MFSDEKNANFKMKNHLSQNSLKSHQSTNYTTNSSTSILADNRYSRQSRKYSLENDISIWKKSTVSLKFFQVNKQSRPIETSDNTIVFSRHIKLGAWKRLTARKMICFVRAEPFFETRKSRLSGLLKLDNEGRQRKLVTCC